MGMHNVSYVLEIDWGAGWVNESSRLISASGNMQVSAPGSQAVVGRGMVSDMMVTLRNGDARYSPFNASSPLYAYIGGNGAYQRPVRLSVSVGAGQQRIFTGIMKIPQEQTPTPQAGAAVRIDCRGREDTILTGKLTTTATAFVTNHDAGLNESEWIASILTAAGLADGTDFISQASNPATATLDPGLFVIPWVWLDDESPVEDCWQLAAACGGRFYADPDGLFRYDNAYSWLANDTAVRAYGRDGSTGLQPVFTDAELFGGVSVEAAPRQVLNPGVMWEPDAVIAVPANETVTVTAKLRQPAYEIIEIQYTAVTAGGISIDADVTVTPTVYAQRVEFSIANVNATYAAYLRNFSIIGRAVSGATSHEEVRYSDSAYWASRPGRVRSVRGNPYIQSVEQAAFLAEMLRDIHEQPRPVYTLPRTPGYPQLRLGDRIEISDEKLGISDREAFVIGIRWELGGGIGFRQSLTAIDAAAYFPHMDGDGYFVLGVDGLDAFGKRIFY